MYEQDDYTENHLFTYSVLENQIQGLSRTFIHRFKDFQEPCPFSRTSKVWKIRKKIQGLSKTGMIPG